MIERGVSNTGNVYEIGALWFWQFFFFSDLSSRKAGQCVDRKMLHDRSRRVESESCKKYGCVWDRDPSIHLPKANRNSSQHLIRNMVFSIAIIKST